MIKNALIADGWLESQPIYSNSNAQEEMKLSKMEINILPAYIIEDSEFNGIMKLKKYRVYYNSAESPNLHFECKNAKFLTVNDRVTKIIENKKKYPLLLALSFVADKHF